MSAEFRMFGGTIHAALIHAATAYDRRQEARSKSYNRYALGHYFRGIERAEEEIARGVAPRAALMAVFSDRLLDAMLKAIGGPVPK